MTIPIDSALWASGGPILALLGIVLSLSGLGWHPTVRLLTRTPPPRTAFRYYPRLVPPVVVVGAMFGSGSLWVLAVLRLGQPAGLLLVPLVALGVERLIMAVARERYRRRLRDQLQVALGDLAALTASATHLAHAFRQIAARPEWPLHDEWTWVEQHVNVARRDPQQPGTGQTRYSTHADALTHLARQTPLPTHAQVLRHLASIYAQQAQGQAAERIGQLAEVLNQQTKLRRQIGTLLGEVQLTAMVVSAALALVMVLITLMQPERVVSVFVTSPLGPVAALWFGLWLIAPLLAAAISGRVPELPL